MSNVPAVGLIVGVAASLLVLYAVDHFLRAVNRADRKLARDGDGLTDLLARHRGKALPLLPLLMAGGRVRPMQLAFEVGEQERHEVVFAFDKFWGGLSVSVDGRKVIRDLRLFSLSTVKTYELEVGDGEKHHVRIDKHRKVLGAGLREQPIKAYVDGQLVAEGAA